MDQAAPDARLNGWVQQKLERHVRERTGGRVRDLSVEVWPGLVILQGRADSYYVKQLAQHGVRDLLPTVTLHNAIAVAGPADDVG